VHVEYQEEGNQKGNTDYNAGDGLVAGKALYFEQDIELQETLKRHYWRREYRV